MSLYSTRYINVATTITTATNNVLFGPIDVRGYEFYSLCVQNGHTAIDAIGLRLQVAMDPSADFGNGTSGAPNWVDVPSASVPGFPLSALLKSATLFTSAIMTNSNWIRIIGGLSTTAVANLKLTITGKKDEQ